VVAEAEGEGFGERCASMACNPVSRDRSTYSGYSKRSADEW